MQGSGGNEVILYPNQMVSIMIAKASLEVLGPAEKTRSDDGPVTMRDGRTAGTVLACSERRAQVRLVDWALLMLCNLIWASQFVLAKLVQEQMGPIFATLLPMALATLCLMPLVRRQRRGRRALGVSHPGVRHRQLRRDRGVRPSRRAARSDLGSGTRAGIERGAAIAHVAHCDGDHGVLAARRAHDRRALGELRACRCGGVLQCSGVDWSDLRFAGGRVVIGNLLILVGVLGSAFYNVYSKKLLHRYTPLEVLLYSYYAVLICLVPLTLYLEPGAIRGMASYRAEGLARHRAAGGAGVLSVDDRVPHGTDAA